MWQQLSYLPCPHKFLLFYSVLPCAKVEVMLRTVVSATLIFLSYLYATSSFQQSPALFAVTSSTSLLQSPSLSYNHKLCADPRAREETEADIDVGIQYGEELGIWSVGIPRSESSRYADSSARGLLSCAAAAAAVAFHPQMVSAAEDQIGIQTKGPKASNRPLVYSVEMTDPPCLQPRTTKGEDGVVNRLNTADVVLMGEHYASNEDHKLQADIIKRLLKSGASKRPISIGLEAVDFRYQRALDDYIADNGNGESLTEADARLRTETHWDEVWKICAFESYLPVFHLAREKKIKLVALGLPEELKLRVKDKGLDGLTADEKSSSITDPQAFVNYVKTPGFTRYTERIIVPAYQKLKSRGILSERATPESYFGYRIYEDEAISTLIANSAAKGLTFIALVGNGRTKFGYGIQERISRILKSKFDDGTTSSTQDVDVVSMLLNPSANDSESPTAQLLLTLGYGPILKEQRPLANYLWFSTSPPTKILTRPKNPISAEDEKPAGESSIIGAFGNRKSSDKAIGGATAGDK